MENLFQKYAYTPDREAIGRSIEILAENLDNVVSDAVLKTCFSVMDLTSLGNGDTPGKIASLTAKVNSFRESYPSYPLPASICVFPNLAGVVAENRTGDFHVTAVAACFPTAQSFLEVKVLEAEMAVENGADEIDIVLALNSFLVGDYESARREIRAVRQAVDRKASALGRTVVLKVILETGLLVTPEKIAEASFLAMEEGADFIKTSTGKVDVNATPVAAYVMCQCIKAFHEKTGRMVGFKPAGGISSAMDAVGYYSIVSSVLGKQWLDKKYFRLGVSRLANNLMSAIEKKTVAVF